MTSFDYSRNTNYTLTPTKDWCVTHRKDWEGGTNLWVQLKDSETIIKRNENTFTTRGDALKRAIKCMEKERENGNPLIRILPDPNDANNKNKFLVTYINRNDKGYSDWTTYRITSTSNFIKIDFR
jgi:hypothetical protein